jgi:acetyltransferase-like isoleucine patch superfamily enzyme
MTVNILNKIKPVIRLLFNVFYKRYILFQCRLFGPPRVLNYSTELNADLLRHFGAKVGRHDVRIWGPITFHETYSSYKNLNIEDGCAFNGNNFLDLSSTITLQKGVSIGPGVTIMTHNFYNRNKFLEDRLPHTCGRKGVLIKEGAGIKAHALIIMGVTIGRNAVVAGGAVVNRDVPDNSFVAGVPARIIKKIE